MNAKKRKFRAHLSDGSTMMVMAYTSSGAKNRARRILFLNGESVRVIAVRDVDMPLCVGGIS